MENIAAGGGQSPPGTIAPIPRRGTFAIGTSPKGPATVGIGQQGASAFSASEYDISRLGTESGLVRHSSNPALSPTKPRAPLLTEDSQPRALKKGSFTSLARSVLSVFGSRHNISEPRKVKVGGPHTVLPCAVDGFAHISYFLCARHGMGVCHPCGCTSRGGQSEHIQIVDSGVCMP